jgi:hypothetical protein
MARLKKDTYAKCETCGVRFRKWTQWQRFHSDACRKKAQRKRRVRHSGTLMPGNEIRVKNGHIFGVFEVF